jgi:hypothetical protein
MGKRLSQGEKKHAKRMATAATVYTIAAYVRRAEAVMQDLPASRGQEGAGKGPLSLSKRVWASVEKEPEAVKSASLHRGAPTRPDGCQIMGCVGRWRLRAATSAAVHHPKREQKHDHRDEYHPRHRIPVEGGSRVSSRFIPFPAASRLVLEGWGQHRLDQILQGKAGLLAGGMRRSATRRKLSPEERKSVDTCACYLLIHSQYLQYDRYLARGLRLPPA